MLFRFDVPEFLEWVVESWAPVGVLADRAAYSRSHFSRKVAKSIGEPPEALRRRLRLEAGAHMLQRTDWSVGMVAIEVGFATQEAFSKAFKAAFALSPKAFRRSSLTPLIPTSSGIHFHPSGMIVRRQGDIDMTLTEILIRHHVDEVARLIEAAGRLENGQLDQGVLQSTDEIPFDPYEGTLRALLDRLVATQEVWMAAFEGASLPDPRADQSLEGLTLRHTASSERLIRFVSEVEAQSLWGSEFVDALCCPPQRFTFGGVIAHILEFSTHRRQKAYSALRALGIADIGYGDPIVWDLERTGTTA